MLGRKILNKFNLVIQERIKINLGDRFNEHIEKDYEDELDFINAAFTWSYSNEGHDYWNDIASNPIKYQIKNDDCSQRIFFNSKITPEEDNLSKLKNVIYLLETNDFTLTDKKLLSLYRNSKKDIPDNVHIILKYNYNQMKSNIKIDYKNGIRTLYYIKKDIKLLKDDKKK